MVDSSSRWFLDALPERELVGWGGGRGNKSAEVKRNFVSNTLYTLTVPPIAPLGPRSPVWPGFPWKIKKPDFLLIEYNAVNTIIINLLYYFSTLQFVLMYSRRYHSVQCLLAPQGYQVSRDCLGTLFCPELRVVLPRPVRETIFLRFHQEGSNNNLFYLAISRHCQADDFAEMKNIINVKFLQH